MKSFKHFLQEATDSDSSQRVLELAAKDQSARIEYNAHIQRNKGDWKKTRREWVAAGKGTEEDIFGDAAHREEVISLLRNPEKLVTHSNDKVRQAAFILAQHADHHPETQERYRDALHAAGLHDTDHFKYITDRILCNKGGKQQFGTQRICGSSE